MFSFVLALALSEPPNVESVVKDTLRELRAQPYDQYEDKTGLLRPFQLYSVIAEGRAAIFKRRGWEPVRNQTWRYGDREISLFKTPDVNIRSRRDISVAKVLRIPAFARELMKRREQMMYKDLGAFEEFTTLVGEAGTNILLFPAGRGDRLLFITNDLTVEGKSYDFGIYCYGYTDGKPSRIWMAGLVPNKSAPSKGSLDQYLRGLELYKGDKPVKGWRVDSPPNGANRDILAHTGYALSIEHSGDSGTTVGFIHPDGRRQSNSFMDEIEFTLAEEKYLKRS